MNGSELLDSFDRKTFEAMQELQQALDAEESSQVARLVEAAQEAAQQAWERAKSGAPRGSTESQQGMRWTEPGEVDIDGEPQVAGSPVFSAALRGDPDEDGTQRTARNVKLQKELSLLVDNTKLRRLLSSLHEAGDHPTLRRLQELRDPDVCHTWLWHIDPRGGTILKEADFTTAVKHRLGAHFTSEPVQCRVCGDLMSTTASHALCCAPAESTAGHYTVVRATLDGLRVADSSAVTEVRGLVENSTARPADIYTNAAIPGRDAALDITIVSQDALAAGEDCCATAFRRKIRRYRDLLEPLARDGVAFRPMVWSAEGRPHPVVGRVIAFASELASRKHPETSARSFAQRWRREIAVAIQKRLARMVQACLPAPSQRAAMLLRPL
eukprot:TRINITY_DN1578_c0_g1_i1.p1 TRINITY_DN1578_c0_g1~~TRINITY_DN1578_c0_g1_i1.p1  ORF type:complete len:384 (+),score=60.22 TRINITY_DN1578_c0_g1_i1:335-1486(+)